MPYSPRLQMARDTQQLQCLPRGGSAHEDRSSGLKPHVLVQRVLQGRQAPTKAPVPGGAIFLGAGGWQG